MKKIISPFNLTHTFECGQCFRWNKNQDESYTGVAFDRVLTISQNKDEVLFNEYDPMWDNYFDITTDYNKIQLRLSENNEIMKNVISMGYGIRILNQDFFETVISFIISQNNNIPRIKSIVEKLCENYGKPIKHKGKTYFTFPKAEILAELIPSDLAFLKAGYRDSYIIDAAQKISLNAIDADIIKNAPINEARAEISKIKGVGPKVADCILLFGAKRTSVFPTDVWMKKVLTQIYKMDNLTPNTINQFANKNFGDLAGYAQQYLFYSAREQNLK